LNNCPESDLLLISVDPASTFFGANLRLKRIEFNSHIVVQLRGSPQAVKNGFIRHAVTAQPVDRKILVEKILAPDKND
jgi:hypothetical protein